MRASMTQNSFLDKELLNSEWENNPRWEGITRNYSAEDVVSIRNSIEIKYTLAENGANNLFDHLMKKDEWISALGCLLYTSPSPRDATLSRMPSSA